MGRYFRTKEGKLVDIVDHTLEQVKKYPNLTIRIGTDSQNFGDATVYVTAITYRYGSKGAHYIYLKQRVNRESVDYLRLYAEGVRTIETYGVLTAEIPISVEGLEFDYADVKQTISTKLVSTFKGWTAGFGTRAIFKSEEMIATKAADHLCRNKQV